MCHQNVTEPQAQNITQKVHTVSLAAETCLYAACLYLDLTHSVYFLCDILCLRFGYILMTHATAPSSACTFAQVRPTMSCICLVLWNAL